eukprot:GHVR01094565.1.p1 GENE.GHVR01094565.1~~GHVR01094565.1.p1  ORF type:complete len:322 (-),score=35.38 GHVR01094565.1:102-944(-)
MNTLNISTHDAEFINKVYEVFFTLAAAERAYSLCSEVEKLYLTIIAMDKFKGHMITPTKKYIITSYINIYKQLNTRNNCIYEILYFTQRLPLIMDIDIKMPNIEEYELLPVGHKFLQRIVGLNKEDIEKINQMTEFNNVRKLEINVIKMLINVMHTKMNFNEDLLKNIKIKTGSEKRKISLHILFPSIKMFDAASCKDISRDTALCLFEELLNNIINKRQLFDGPDLDLIYALQAHRLGKSSRSKSRKKCNHIALEEVSYNDYIYRLFLCRIMILESRLT